MGCCTPRNIGCPLAVIHELCPLHRSATGQSNPQCPDSFFDGCRRRRVLGSSLDQAANDEKDGDVIFTAGDENECRIDSECDSIRPGSLCCPDGCNVLRCFQRREFDR